MTERKMIEEKDVEQALDVLERYWVGKDLTADNSILREKVRDWVKQAIPMNVEGVTQVFSAKDLKGDYTYQGPTLDGSEFTSRYKHGDLVEFNPKGDLAILAVVMGVIILGPKVSYHLGLCSGAEVRTYGNRVSDLKDNVVIDQKDENFLQIMLDNCKPGL